MNSTTFREIVSGRQTGVVASLLRIMLRGAEVPYTWAVAARNRRYDREVAPIHRVAVPVVCVGNLTLGGTGKTPMVQWIVRCLQASGVQAAIVSRGYGSQAGQPNDEAMLLELVLPGVPHLQNPDRVAAARQVIRQFDAQAIVLDDGFQHRRLGRDLDIVLLDATEPFGFEHVFPRGTLREPATGLARAQVVVLSRADMLQPVEREKIRERVRQLAPHAVWCEVQHRPSQLLGTEGLALPLSELRGKRVAAFCGIGNPAGFRHTLDALGCEVVGWREFADHHLYTASEIDALSDWANSLEAELALCTQKDWVKINRPALGNLPLRALGIELAFLSGQALLETALREAAKTQA